MMTLRLRRAALVLALATPALTAQQASPADQLIQRVLNDVNDLRYSDAILLGRQLVDAGGLTPSQVVRLRFVLAAAYFPEEIPAQQPDSAIAQFSRALRVQPDAQIPVDLNWSGLDSLLSIARARTLAVVARPESETFAVTATGPAIPLVATRPVRFRLSTRSLASGAEVVHATSDNPATRASLPLYAQADGRALLERGQYDFIVTIVDPVVGDSTRYVRRLIVEEGVTAGQAAGAATRAKMSPRRVVVTGLLFSLATFAVADAFRGEGAVRSVAAADGRAAVVGLGMLGATGWAAWRERELVDASRVRDLATYSVMVRLGEEVR